MEHHDAIHHYTSARSPVHALDARIKIILSFTFILLIVSIPPHNLMSFAIFSGLLLWGIAASLLPLTFILKRGAIVLPFSALIAIGLPFLHGGQTVEIFGLALSQKGLWLFWGATIKAFLSATTIVLLITTTPFHILMSSLRALGVPGLFVDMLALTYRYIFVLTEEASRLRRAAIARGYKPKWLPQSIIIGRLIGSLFIRSYERAERVYNAMRLRGYNGEVSEPNSVSLSIRQKVCLVVTVVVLCCVRVVI